MRIRRLNENDFDILVQLAAEDGEFDIDGRGEPIEAPHPVRGRRYLANPDVLFWISEHDGVISGFLQCLVLPIRTGKGREVLVYEIGVRKPFRRQGVGRALMLQVELWMREEDVDELWVAADNPGAERFYNACGYERTGPEYFQPVYMTRELE